MKTGEQQKQITGEAQRSADPQNKAGEAQRSADPQIKQEKPRGVPIHQKDTNPSEGG